MGKGREEIGAGARDGEAGVRGRGQEGRRGGKEKEWRRGRRVGRKRAACRRTVGDQRCRYNWAATGQGKWERDYRYRLLATWVTGTKPGAPCQSILSISWNEGKKDGQVGVLAQLMVRKRAFRLASVEKHANIIS